MCINTNVVITNETEKEIQMREDRKLQEEQNNKIYEFQQKNQGKFFKIPEKELQRQ